MRYGYLHPYLAAFLASVDSSAYLLFFTSPSALGILHAYFTTCLPFALAELFHPPGLTIFLCHCIIYTNFGSTGISTSCPSSTPFDLDLGPDLPWADEPSPGNLRLSTGRFLASLSLLMPAFSLVSRPSVPFGLTSAFHTLLLYQYTLVYSQASVSGLAPIIFRASSLDQ